MELRPIGRTDILVTPVAMGCWPISGITSINVTEANSLATLEAAVDAGINFFDTAYVYGYEGESERMIARALGHRREEIVLATKGGVHWKDRQQARDASPATLRKECEESLVRLNTEYVDLYYLHGPDPTLPVSESAGGLLELMQSGKIRSVGVSNVNATQLEEFSKVCPISAYQPPYNVLQRDIEQAELPWCREHGVSVMVYWPLMKGLLAGKLKRDHVFDANDGRQNLPMFQGEEWQKNHDLLDRIEPIAEATGKSMAQVVINWTIHRPGVTVALCGAKRPDQIRDNAASMGWQLTDEQTREIDAAIRDRGPTVSHRAFTKPSSSRQN